MNKEKRPMTYDPDANMIRNLFTQIRLTWLLLWDWRVPFWVKSIFYTSLLYVASPIDLVPEALLLFLGYVDDIGALIIGMKMLMELSPAEVVAEHMETITGKSAWEVEEKKKKSSTKTDDGSIIEGDFTEKKDE